MLEINELAQFQLITIDPLYGAEQQKLEQVINLHRALK